MDYKKDLEKYPIIREFEVLWGHMDAANHVNNIIYLKWAESARIDYFEKMGMDISFSGDEVGPILGWQDCKYIFPLTYPDTAICGVRISEIKEDRFIMECSIYSKKYERIAAISSQSIIPYSYKNLKKTEMPELWIKGIERLQNS